MSKKALQASLALWRRRRTWNQQRTRSARRRGNHAAVARYQARTAHCSAMVSRRVRQIRQLEQTAANTPRRRMLKHAATFIGETEQPPGSNQGPNISRWQIMFLGFDGVPWCGTFCGAMLRWAGVAGVNSRIASVALIEDDARAGRTPFASWSGSAKGATPGDLAVIGGRGVHVELIETVHADGSVTTIGGNTSPGQSGSQANGGGVWRRERSVAAIHGVAHVRFPKP